MQPQFRQVPPSTGARSTTAVRRPTCAARMAATYPPVPDPITTTSYSVAIRRTLLILPADGGQRHERDRRCRRGRRWRVGFSAVARIEPRDLGAQPCVVVAQLPVGLGERVQLPGQPPYGRQRPRRNEQAYSREQPHHHNRRTLPVRFKGSQWSPSAL